MTNGIENLLSIKKRWRLLVPDEVVVKVVRHKEKKIVFIVTKPKEKKGRPLSDMPIKKMTKEQYREYNRKYKKEVRHRKNPNIIPRTSRKYFIGPLTKEQTWKKKYNTLWYKKKVEKNLNKDLN